MQRPSLVRQPSLGSTAKLYFRDLHMMVPCSAVEHTPHEDTVAIDLDAPSLLLGVNNVPEWFPEGFRYTKLKKEAIDAHNFTMTQEQRGDTVIYDSSIQFELDDQAGFWDNTAGRTRNQKIAASATSSFPTVSDVPYLCGYSEMTSHGRTHVSSSETPTQNAIVNISRAIEQAFAMLNICKKGQRPDRSTPTVCGLVKLKPLIYSVEHNDLEFATDQPDVSGFVRPVYIVIVKQENVNPSTNVTCKFHYHVLIRMNHNMRKSMFSFQFVDQFSDTLSAGASPDRYIRGFVFQALRDRGAVLEENQLTLRMNSQAQLGDNMASYVSQKGVLDWGYFIYAQTAKDLADKIEAGITKSYTFREQVAQELKQSILPKLLVVDGGAIQKDPIKVDKVFMQQAHVIKQLKNSLGATVDELRDLFSCQHPDIPSRIIEPYLNYEQERAANQIFGDKLISRSIVLDSCLKLRMGMHRGRTTEQMDMLAILKSTRAWNIVVGWISEYVKLSSRYVDKRKALYIQGDSDSGKTGLTQMLFNSFKIVVTNPDSMLKTVTPVALKPDNLVVFVDEHKPSSENRQSLWKYISTISVNTKHQLNPEFVIPRLWVFASTGTFESYVESEQYHEKADNREQTAKQMVDRHVVLKMPGDFTSTEFPEITNWATFVGKLDSYEFTPEELDYYNNIIAIELISESIKSSNITLDSIEEQKQVQSFLNTPAQVINYQKSQKDVNRLMWGKGYRTFMTADSMIITQYIRQLPTLLRKRSCSSAEQEDLYSDEE